MSMNLKEMQREFRDNACKAITSDNISQFKESTKLTISDELVNSIIELSNNIAYYYDECIYLEVIDDNFDNSIKKFRSQNKNSGLFPYAIVNNNKQYCCNDITRDILFIYDYCFRFNSHQDETNPLIPHKELDDFFFGKLQKITPTTLLHMLKTALCVSFKNNNFGALIFSHFDLIGRLNELYNELDYQKNSFFPWEEIVQIIYNQILFYEDDQYDSYIQTLNTLRDKIDLCLDGIKALKHTINKQ